MAETKITKEFLKQEFIKSLKDELNITPNEASDQQIYNALSSIVVKILKEKRQRFINTANSQGRKQVYYLSMEFLMGRSLKTSLYNLRIVDEVKDMLKEFGVTNMENIYNNEPDAGLGNGGLGRLAACYLDGLAATEYPAMGYSICYEYGIFKQKIEDVKWLLMFTSRANSTNTGTISITTFHM